MQTYADVCCSGAFFMPRSLMDDPLWAAVLSEYTKVLVRSNQWVEFFIEARRSRTGIQLTKPQVYS